MIVYYIHTSLGAVGSLSLSKIEKMYRNDKILFCDISDFKGQLLSSEYN